MFFFEQNWCKENYPGVGLCCYFLRRFLDDQSLIITVNVESTNSIDQELIMMGAWFVSLEEVRQKAWIFCDVELLVSHLLSTEVLYTSLAWICFRYLAPPGSRQSRGSHMDGVKEWMARRLSGVSPFHHVFFDWLEVSFAHLESPFLDGILPRAVMFFSMRVGDVCKEQGSNFKKHLSEVEHMWLCSMSHKHVGIHVKAFL